MGDGDDSLSLTSMDLESKSLGFLACLSFFSCSFVKFLVSVLNSFEGFNFCMGWSRSQAWRWAGFMSSQSRGSSTSEPDDSESEYSSVEEMYGSGSWVCCRVSVEIGYSVGSGD